MPRQAGPHRPLKKRACDGRRILPPGRARPSSHPQHSGGDAWADHAVMPPVVARHSMQTMPCAPRAWPLRRRLATPAQQFRPALPDDQSATLPRSTSRRATRRARLCRPVREHDLATTSPSACQCRRPTSPPHQRHRGPHPLQSFDSDRADRQTLPRSSRHDQARLVRTAQVRRLTQMFNACGASG